MLKWLLLAVLVFLVTCPTDSNGLPAPFDFLAPTPQVSTESPAPDIQILVVSIGPKRCPPCGLLKPVVDRLESQGYNTMTVGSHPRPKRYPSIFIFKDEKLVDIITGLVDEKTLKERIHAQSTP